MKKLNQILAVAALVAMANSAMAAVTITGGTATTSGSQTPGLIPDGNINGVSSTVNLSGSTLTSITDVQVVLHGSGTFNGDIYAYLTHDGVGGGFAVLLNRVGVTAGGTEGETVTPNAFGYSDAGFGGAGADGLRLSDSGANDVHFYNGHSPAFATGGQLKGTWQPDGRNIDPGSSGAAFDAASLSRGNFGSFNGVKSGDGNWTLFVADMSSGETTTIDSWDLEITGVPEPVDYALMAFGGIFAAVQGMRYLKRRKAAQA